MEGVTNIGAPLAGAGHWLETWVGGLLGVSVEVGALRQAEGMDLGLAVAG